MAGKLAKMSEADMAVLARLRHVVPWFLGLIVMPPMIVFFRLLWADSLPATLIAVVLLTSGTAALTYLAWKQGRARRSLLAKWFPVVYTAAPLAFFTLSVAIGWGDYPGLDIRHSPMFILWLIGTIALSACWNFYYRVQGRIEEAAAQVAAAVIAATPLLEIEQVKVEPAALAAASRILPADVVEATPELADPEVVKALEAVRARKAELQAQATMEAAKIKAQKVIACWRTLTRPSVVDEETGERTPGGVLAKLAKVELTKVSGSDYATDVRMYLRDGITPGDVDDPNVQEVLATQLEVGASDVRFSRNRRNNSDLLMRVVWFDPLEKPRWWTGPQNVGTSFGEVPVTFGVREDNSPARMLLPHNDDFGKVSSHVLAEGKNGSGKSSVMLIVVGEGSTRPDVCFWGIDLAKGVQTFKHVAPAMDWLVVDLATARFMVKALVDVVIPQRGTLLAKLGYDNWTPELARKHKIPYLVLVMEEGGVLFQGLGKAFANVLMLARSVGICIWGSIQRAHHDLIDTNARAQFSEFLTFGVTDNDDVFGMPDAYRDKINPAQWNNRFPGMHYHLNPLLTEEEVTTPQRTDRPETKLLREVTAKYGPGMMRPEKSMVDAINRYGDGYGGKDEDFWDGAYDNRETGLDVERRLFADGAVALDDRETVERITAEQVPNDPAERESITLNGVMPAQEEVVEAEEMPALPAQREPADPVRRRPYAPPVADPDVDEDDDDGLAAEIEAEVTAYLQEQMRGVTQAPADNEERMIVMYGAGGRPDAIQIGDEVLELEEIDRDADGDPDEPEERLSGNVDTDGSADDEFAATAVPLTEAENFTFLATDEDFEPSDTREGAKHNMLLYLKRKGSGWVFQPADLYKDMPHVDRAKSWIRGELRILADSGLYVTQIDDPSDVNDGKYVVTARIAEYRRAITASS